MPAFMHHLRRLLLGEQQKRLQYYQGRNPHRLAATRELRIAYHPQYMDTDTP